jgi:hypothetical protein
MDHVFYPFIKWWTHLNSECCNKHGSPDVSVTFWFPLALDAYPNWHCWILWMFYVEHFEKLPYWLWKWAKGPFSPHPHHHLLFLSFSWCPFKCGEMISHCSLDLHFLHDNGIDQCFYVLGGIHLYSFDNSIFSLLSYFLIMLFVFLLLSSGSTRYYGY